MNQPSLPRRDELRVIAERAMVQRGLLPDFSAAVLAETDALVTAAAEMDPSISDLRGLLWCSIDNDDTRDLDQLTAAETRPGGLATILVAVADVDAMVKVGSAIDGHARRNTTSVYTAAGVFPMLPEKLSTDLTSLGEGQVRLALVIELGIDADGTLAEADVYRAVVCNQAKLAYNGVAAWLEGTAPAPPRLAAVPGLEEQIHLQDRTAQALKTLRRQHGALSLETLETRPVFEGDVLIDLRPEEKNRAKQLIEDFMIAANGMTARYLDRKGFPSLRRVLRSPDRWDRIVELATRLGGRLGPVPSAPALEEFLAERRQADPERFRDLSLSIVKLLGSGEYAVEPPGQQVDGHFGLAVRDYSHSTAPNRRFPDLITQRLLKAALAGRPLPYGLDELNGLARHCTEQEDNAAKVERQVEKSAAALLLASRIGDRFEAIVTGASEKGTWVRILQPPVEGKVVRGFEGLDVGDRVRVELAGTNVERGFIDFVRLTSG
ncbi:MAG TPA: RNB domain-containing ribonuclease [Anaerolineales bacterium]|nr:RNB domain-containing ribonuclease [Anaerolineales bacterium]